jgi:peptide/nickel transport system substrate-binding protein
MSDEMKLTRRSFLRATAAAAVTAMVASCAQPTDEPEPPAAQPTKAPAAATEVPAPTSKYREAPMLAEMVKAGTLPPVEERLPEDPMVVEPWKSVGEYGGTWRMATLGSNDGAILIRSVAYEFPLRWDHLWSEFLPNLAKSWEVNADGSEYTFNLRRGMKWNDGEPLTADDWEFTFKDVVANKELSPKMNSTLIIAGEEAMFTKIDDNTVKYGFAATNGGFLRDLAGTGNGNRLRPYPKHWLMQHHEDYADAAELAAKIKEAGFETWVEYWGSLHVYPHGRKLGYPVPWGWYARDTDLGDAPEFVMDRNPYYWKVDTQGNQLPYIDKVLLKVHEDKETILLAALAGEIDCQKRHLDRADAVPLLKEASDKQNFGFFKLVRAKMNHCIIHFNQCTPNDALRPIFQNMDFRIAMSLGINRDEINNVALAGQSEPWQPAPLRASPYFNENYAKRYTEHDPDTANAMLDKILPQKDGDGFRLLPDGSDRFLVIIETPSDFRKEWIDTLQIVQNQWKVIGVDMQIKAEERSLYQTRTVYDHDAGVWEGDIGYDGYYGVPSETPGYANAYACWQDWFNSDGAQGTEPPQVAKDMVALENELRMTLAEDKRAAIIKQIQDMSPLWHIGTCQIPPGFGVVKNNFHNMPEEIADLWLMPTIAGANPEQFWIES